MEQNGTKAKERLALLFDGGTYTELDALRTEKDAPAAVICAHGYVEGQPVCCTGFFLFTYDFSGNQEALPPAFQKLIICCRIFRRPGES
jgi:acetyl-CoA carboxylase carboxyltransferase component